MQRRRDLRLEGDVDAYCWPSGEVPAEELVYEKVRQLAPHRGEAWAQQAEVVAQRLMGPWHKPAVLEALGCFIPREFHPRYDGRKPRCNVKGSAPSGVHLQAGMWKVDVFEE